MHVQYRRKYLPKFKKYFIQICDHKMQIRAINAKYGGAAHDSFVWSLSAENRFMKDNWRNWEKGSWLLGMFVFNIIPSLII